MLRTLGMVLLAPLTWLYFLPVHIRNLVTVWTAYRGVGFRYQPVTEAELRLREALSLLGWPDAFLSPDGRDARITWRRGRYGLEPWWRVARWLHPRAFFPIEDLLARIESIRFNGVLRGDRGFEGLLEPPADREFPYDEALEVFNPIDVRGSAFDGGRWFGLTNRSRYYKADILVFCFTHEVSVRLRR